MDVRELESKQQEQQAGPCPLHEVVVAAGQACAEAVAGSGDRAPEEVFYALPTSTVAQFFKQVAAVAANAGRNPGQASVDFDAVAQLSKGVQARLFGLPARVVCAAGTLDSGLQLLGRQSTCHCIVYGAGGARWGHAATGASAAVVWAGNQRCGGGPR